MLTFSTACNLALWGHLATNLAAIGTTRKLPYERCNLQNSASCVTWVRYDKLPDL